MRNLTVVVAWHGGSPKVSTNYIDPKGSTFSPENPRRLRGVISAQKVLF